MIRTYSYPVYQGKRLLGYFNSLDRLSGAEEMTTKTLEQEMEEAYTAYNICGDGDMGSCEANAFRAGARWGFQRGAEEMREMFAKDAVYPDAIRALPLPQLKGE